MNRYFGARWDAGTVDDAVQVPTPVGEKCLTCLEPVVDGDRGLIEAYIQDLSKPAIAAPIHAECSMMRATSHLLQLCHCHGYEQDRATARLVWRRLEEKRGRSFDDLRPAAAGS